MPEKAPPLGPQPFAGLLVEGGLVLHPERYLMCASCRSMPADHMVAVLIAALVTACAAWLTGLSHLTSTYRYRYIAMDMKVMLMHAQIAFIDCQETGRGGTAALWLRLTQDRVGLISGLCGSRGSNGDHP
jgi:hypothetical protein